ncbi:response regulator [Heliobacterium gestii]|uniref:Stage 0 sporulation protein A homolog n=1 Tax=Heliomicrobium gestii TaxID=2699 RepID=A0A845L6Z7_HELGE|nr:response regulator [Heliomicrobium gestii]MBM7866969.1 YesN/AraC family two-component response regulator [Heliomicrobium gestii]MZP42392.1 response regulator [Heliomicrobium gestii]
MCTLLVVDDESLERQAIRQIIKREDLAMEVVGEAASGDDAVALAETVRPDVVLLDIRMPGLNGIEVMKRLRGFLPDCRIIILTAFDEFQYAREAVQWGAFNYLLKPVRPAELVRVLATAADQVREEGEKRAEAERLRHQAKLQAQNAAPLLRLNLFAESVHITPSGVLVSMERSLLEKIRCGERREAQAGLQALLDEALQRWDSLETVKTYLVELLILLSRSAMEGGAQLNRLSLSDRERIEGLLACRTKEDCRAWTERTLESLFDSMVDNRSSANRRLINRACEYITANCQRNLSLEEVARSAHLSPYYFSRIFKTEKGCNFVDFLTNARMERAKKLLTDTDNNLIQIAGQVGYQDSSYFCRVFRKETGMTPNRYRKEMRRGNFTQAISK